MPKKFDPVRLRELRQKYSRLGSNDLNSSSSSYYHVNVTADIVAIYVEAILLGLEASVQPKFDEAFEMMEKRGMPLAPGEVESVEWFAIRFRWWSSLGAARWLAHGVGAESCFDSALEVLSESYERFRTRQGWNMPRQLRSFMAEVLGVALNADAPATGLRFFEESGLKGPGVYDGPQRAFGRWACNALATGGSRDADFVNRGTNMMRKYLMSPYCMIGVSVEPALWLKAIYFDAGVTTTPRETLLKVYDVLKIERPDFVR